MIAFTQDKLNKRACGILKDGSKYYGRLTKMDRVKNMNTGAIVNGFWLWIESTCSPGEKNATPFKCETDNHLLFFECVQLHDLI